MTFKTLLVIKAVVCLSFAPVLLFLPTELLRFLGTSLDLGGTFTAREYGAALFGGFMLTLLARNVTAADARRAILLYLFVYDAIGFGVTLHALTIGLLNQFALGIAFVYLFFTAGAGYLLVQGRPAAEAGGE